MQQLPFHAQKLTDRAAIGINGADAVTFLQGLVTADVAGLAEGAATYAALLQPQGKILFDFFVLRVVDGFLIDCDAGEREELRNRLTFYKLRAKLTINERDDDIGISYVEPDEPLRYRDPRNRMLGWRFFAAAGSLQAGDIEPYRGALIRLGIATSQNIGSGQFFPHEANLDQLSGLSFSKGCYVGQEVVSRMEHRGTARSRFLPIRAAGEIEAGAEILAGGKPVGTVLSQVGQDGLAMIRLDRLKDAHEAGAALLTNGSAVTVIKPAWAKFDVAT